MERVSYQAKIFSVIIFIVTLGFFAWKILPFSITDANRQALMIFGIIALLFEIRTIILPYFGSAGVNLTFYFAALLLFGSPTALVLAAFIILIRILFISRDNLWARMVDFSAEILALTLACITYEMLNGASALFTHQNIGAAVTAGIVFLFFEFIISATGIGLISQSVQRAWYKVKSKSILVYATEIPLAMLIAAAYQKLPLLALLAVLPLLGLRQTLKFISHELEVARSEELELTVTSLRKKIKEIETKNEEISLDLQRKVDELSTLSELGQELGASISLDSTLEITISMIKRILAYQSCVIFLKDKSELRAIKYVTPHRETLELSPLLHMEEPVVNLVLTSGKPLLVSDMHTTEEQRIFRDEKCVLCIPLIVQNEIIGVLYVGTTKPNSYTEDHKHILTILANAAGIAVKSSQLYESKEEALMMQLKLNEELDKKVEQLSVFFELGQALGSSLNIDNTLNIIVETMEKLVKYQSCIIFMIHESPAGAEFLPKRYVSPYSEYFKNLTFSFTEGILGWVATNRKPLLLEDTRESVLQTLMEYEHSVVAVPLVAENEIIGALYVGEAEPAAFDTDSLALVSTVAYQAAMAIKNAELYDRMKTLAITDGVTGLYTHRYFQERLAEEIKRAERYAQALSLLMIDTDFFKKYNDALGHPQGDILLREIASLLKSYTRESDLVCRYGGDEFVLVLMDTNKENALKKAEAIREAFQIRFNKLPVKITASIGVSTFPDDAALKSDLISAADSALYRSKAGGRNRVSSAIPLEGTTAAE
ncbi:MAG: sensor domain-containing diguanylate cyclase [Firmicutes bacterium]|nr:sensor domain-containing diguanylate cyclase [Bacillota bacterium]